MNALKRPKKMSVLVTDHPVGSLLDTAGVVVALLRTAGVETLDVVEQLMVDGDAETLKKLAKYVLRDEQIDGIEKHRPYLRMLRRSTGASVSLAECDTCGAVSAVEGAASARCGLTLNCDGKPVKATTAKMVPFTPNTSSA